LLAFARLGEVGLEEGHIRRCLCQQTGEVVGGDQVEVDGGLGELGLDSGKAFREPVGGT
jgi:hypothetical protein